MNHRTLYMTGGIALINMVGGFPGGFADRYLIGLPTRKPAAMDARSQSSRQRSPSPRWLYLRQFSR
jgi:hypothetical protein